MAAKKRTPVNTGKKQGRSDVATRFKKGQSGNPAGRPKGSRNKLGEDVLSDFCTLWDFDRLKKLATRNPSLFVKLAVSLIPKQVDIDGEQVVWVMSDRPISNDEWAAKWAAPDPPPQLDSPRRTTKRAR